jgi:hypothetical protein
MAIADGEGELARMLHREVDVVESERARPARGLRRRCGCKDEIDDAERPRQGEFSARECRRAVRVPAL